MLPSEVTQSEHIVSSVHKEKCSKSWSLKERAKYLGLSFIGSRDLNN